MHERAALADIAASAPSTCRRDRCPAPRRRRPARRCSAAPTSKRPCRRFAASADGVSLTSALRSRRRHERDVDTRRRARAAPLSCPRQPAPSTMSGRRASAGAAPRSRTASRSGPRHHGASGRHIDAVAVAHRRDRAARRRAQGPEHRGCTPRRARPAPGSRRSRECAARTCARVIGREHRLDVDAFRARVLRHAPAGRRPRDVARDDEHRGSRSRLAEATPVTALVMPGPAVTTTAGTRPLAR